MKNTQQRKCGKMKARTRFNISGGDEVKMLEKKVPRSERSVTKGDDVN